MTAAGEIVDTPYMARLRAQIGRHEREVVRLTAERDAVYGETSADPAVARLGVTALRQHHRATDRDLARWARLDRRIKGHAFAGSWKRSRLGEHEARQVRS